MENSISWGGAYVLKQDRTEPSFFGTIGVVSSGSSDLATRAPQLLNRRQAPEDAKRVVRLRGLSQAVVYEVIQALLQRADADQG